MFLELCYVLHVIHYAYWLSPHDLFCFVNITKRTDSQDKMIVNISTSIKKSTTCQHWVNTQHDNNVFLISAFQGRFIEIPFCINKLTKAQIVLIVLEIYTTDKQNWGLSQGSCQCNMWNTELRMY